ncbi:hypothetical protein TWF506_007802 [Arthrobotrys conoides]|uniref:Uncharacterized protein n=1 Tax=Arthrobotrys conoides TaxID=74498 RepID=A0AAN8NFD5_9PEZI
MATLPQASTFSIPVTFKVPYIFQSLLKDSIATNTTIDRIIHNAPDEQYILQLKSKVPKLFKYLTIDKITIVLNNPALYQFSYVLLDPSPELIPNTRIIEYNWNNHAPTEIKILFKNKVWARYFFPIAAILFFLAWDTMLYLYMGCQESLGIIAKACLAA